MRTATSLVALAAAFGFTATAHATDLWNEPDEKLQPVQQKRVDWSGPAIGVFLGYGMGNHEMEFVEEEEDVTIVDGFGDEGFLAGAFVEYNLYMTRNLLVGAGVSGEWSNQELDVSWDEDNDVPGWFGPGDASLDKNWGVDGYVQVAAPVFYHHALIGLKGGWSFADYDFDASAGGNDASKNINYDGPFAAIFTRAELGNNWAANLEGSYHWYGEETVFEIDDQSNSFKITDDLNELKVKLGIVRTFN